MPSTQLSRCVDLSEGGGAAGPRFSRVEVREPHPSSCDVAVGGVHGAVDLLALSSVTVWPVVSRLSRRVALEDLLTDVDGWLEDSPSEQGCPELVRAISCCIRPYTSTKLLVRFCRFSCKVFLRAVLLSMILLSSEQAHVPGGP